MREIALPEGHKEPYALYPLYIQRQRLQLLMVQQVHILFAHSLEVIHALGHSLHPGLSRHDRRDDGAYGQVEKGGRA